MNHTLARTTNGELLENVPLERLSKPDIAWYWVDFEGAKKDEIALLSDHFHFDALAIEDCLEHLERPKVDFYDAYNFFVFHSLNEHTLKPIEVDVFAGKNFVVSFHKTKLAEMDGVRKKIQQGENIQEETPAFIVYVMLDQIVDRYFPAVFRLEDVINNMDILTGTNKTHHLMEHIYKIRTDLLKLRHIINSSKELLYRITNAEHLQAFRANKRYFNDIYDHLLMLADTVESNREVTADVRDNYISFNTHKMNKIMTVLTVVTSIFIPLTFITGVYGMNFLNMPEIKWRYGYFVVLGVMAVIGIGMLLWFKRKGWIDLKK